MFSTMTNSQACIFNWSGKGPKRAFKDTLMHNCMLVSLHLQILGFLLYNRFDNLTEIASVSAVMQGKLSNEFRLAFWIFPIQFNGENSLIHLWT